LKDYDAAIITDLMMGGDGTVDEDNLVLGELHLSAISEIMNQMIGSSATAMSNMLGKIVNISPPNATYIDADEDLTKFLEDNSLVVRISFDMEIEGVLKSKLMQMMSLDLARELVATQIGGPAPSASEPAPAAAPEPEPQPAAAPAPAASAPPPPPKPAAPKPAPKPAAPPVSVQPVVVPDFGVDAEAEAYKENLDLISDIPLQVTVELGRTKRSLNDVMNFGNGSIVMLDRLAGDAVDIIVNGKPIAKGEVVVIEENYGVRITEMFAASDGNDQ
jgi:flagellar motor switch protein FliN/FliY